MIDYKRLVKVSKIMGEIRVLDFKIYYNKQRIADATLPDTLKASLQEDNTIYQNQIDELNKELEKWKKSK